MTEERPDGWKSRRVNALRNGTVLDHLNPGTALKAHRALAIPPTALMAIGINLESTKLVHKDIIKIEDVELGQQELNKLALISPNATLSVIRDYEVVQKFSIEMPDEFRGIVQCANPACVTRHEDVETRFRVELRNPTRLRCHYCERVFRPDELEFIPR